MGANGAGVAHGQDSTRPPASLVSEEIFLRVVTFTAQAKAGRVALLLAHENITNGFYPGNDKQLLVANVLFKLGGSAAVMSTRHAALPLGCRASGLHLPDQHLTGLCAGCPHLRSPMQGDTTKSYLGFCCDSNAWLSTSLTCVAVSSKPMRCCLHALDLRRALQPVQPHQHFQDVDQRDAGPVAGRRTAGRPSTS